MVIIQQLNNNPQHLLATPPVDFQTTMDNEGFQKLVRKRASGKTTKEIAREAVQAEWRKKKRRRGRQHNDDYSSEEEDNAGKNPRRRADLEEFRPSQVAKTQKDDGYRDRAKERREGRGFKDENENSEDALLEQQLRGETLRRRTIPAKENEEEIIRYPQDEEQARERMASPSTAATTTLGREILNYWRDTLSDHVLPTEVTPAGRTLQRTTLAFTIRAYPGLRPWQIPVESSFAQEETHVGRNNLATRMDDDLVSKIQEALDNRNKKIKTKPAGSSLKADQQIGGNAASGDKSPSSQNVLDDEDSDDDIFGNVGTYDPTVSSKAKAPENREPIFGSTTALTGNEDEVSGSVSNTPPRRLAGLSSFVGYGEDMDFEVEGREEGGDSDDSSAKKKKNKKKKKRKEGDNDEK